MPDQDEPISGLPNASSVSGSDTTVIVQDGVTKKALISLFPGSVDLSDYLKKDGSVIADLLKVVNNGRVGNQDSISYIDFGTVMALNGTIRIPNLNLFAPAVLSLNATGNILSEARQTGFNVKHNSGAIINPTTSNNSSQGYSFSSTWWDTIDESLWFCVVPATGIWIKLYPQSGSVPETFGFSINGSGDKLLINATDIILNQ